MTIWFSSDHHFYDDRFDIMFRNIFKNVENCNNYFVDKWNDIISNNDTIYYLGDIVYKKNDLTILSRLKGKKHLILGNHDIQSKEEYLKYFETVLDNKLLKIKSKDLKIFLNHYPTRGKINCWNLCGHVHGSWRVQKNIINVSVDCWDYMPVSLEKILFTINSIEKHYDNDIWAAYNKINTNHLERGKRGTYYG